MNAILCLSAEFLSRRFVAGGWVLLFVGLVVSFIAPSHAQTDAPFICHDDDEAFAFHLERGGLLRGQESFEQAFLHYDCALTLQPESNVALRNRALVRLGLRDLSGALIDLDEAIERQPNDHLAHYGRAISLLRLGRTQEALIALNRTLAIMPDFAQAYNTRGVIYGRQGDQDSAISDYERAIELGHEPIQYPYLNLADIYREQGNLERARQSLDSAIRFAPTYAESYRALGDLYVEMGMVAMAEENYNHYIHLTNQADVEVLTYLETVRLRDFVQRYLPSFLIVLIVGYFVVDGIRRLYRTRRATSSPAMQVAPQPIVASTPVPVAKPSIETPSPTPEGEASSGWWAWLLLPVLAGVAIALRALFQDDDKP